MNHNKLADYAIVIELLRKLYNNSGSNRFSKERLAMIHKSLLKLEEDFVDMAVHESADVAQILEQMKQNREDRKPIVKTIESELILIDVEEGDVTKDKISPDVEKTATRPVSIKKAKARK
jgi:hypothetical protein